MKCKFPNKKHKRRKQLRREDLRTVKAGICEMLDSERLDYEERMKYEDEFDWEEYAAETYIDSPDEDEDWYEPPQEPYDDPYLDDYYYYYDWDD